MAVGCFLGGDRAYTHVAPTLKMDVFCFSFSSSSSSSVSYLVFLGLRGL